MKIFIVQPSLATSSTYKVGSGTKDRISGSVDQLALIYILFEEIVRCHPQLIVSDERFNTDETIDDYSNGLFITLFALWCPSWSPRWGFAGDLIFRSEETLNSTWWCGCGCQDQVSFSASSLLFVTTCELFELTLLIRRLGTKIPICHTINALLFYNIASQCVRWRSLGEKFIIHSIYRSLLSFVRPVCVCHSSDRIMNHIAQLGNAHKTPVVEQEPNTHFDMNSTRLETR